MATPVLVVDDSSLSRKLVIKALPPEWDVEVTQASNGQEAIELYRKGKAHVIFLALTMPIMDGYQVLENQKREGLFVFFFFFLVVVFFLVLVCVFVLCFFFF